MVTENTSAGFQSSENYYVNKGLTPLEIPHVTGMKLLGDVSLGSLVLNTRGPDGLVWVCTDIEGWWTIAKPEYPRISKSFGDGSYDVSGRLVERELELKGTILAPDPSYAPSARDTLVRALNLVYSGAWLKTVEKWPTKSAVITHSARSANVVTITVSGVNPFITGDSVIVSSSNSDVNGTFTVSGVIGQTITYSLTGPNFAPETTTGYVESADGYTKAAFVRLADQPDVEVVNARGRLMFAAELTAADPIKYQWYPSDDGYQTVTISPKSSAWPGEYVVTNAGTATVGGLFVVNGPVVGPLSIENTRTGQVLRVNSPLTGDSVTVNVVKRSYFDGYATLTTEGPHGFYVGKAVTVADVDPEFDGTRIVTHVPTDNSFSYLLALAKEGSFTSYKLGETVSITNVSVTANVATLTTSAAHNLAAGVDILLSGFTGGATALNTYFMIQSTPGPTTFTVDVAALTTLAPTAASATGVAPIATLYSSAPLTFIAGDSITVDNVSAAVNTTNGTVLSVAGDSMSLRYHAERSRAIRYKSYTASNTAADDIVTLETWTPHGYRVGDTIYVQGCGRPINLNASTAEIAATVTAATSTTFSFAVSTFYVETASMTVTKSTGKNYRVTVTTETPHRFVTGDNVRLRTPLKSGRVPDGINGVRAITRVNSTRYYYEVVPKSTTKTGLIDFFGAEAGGSPPISIAAKSSLASFENQPVNTQGNGDVGGRAISFAVIGTTPTAGSGDSTVIDEVASGGTVSGGSDQLAIDTAKRSVLLNGEAAYARGKLDAVTDWIMLLPGNNTLKVADNGDADSDATVTIKYRSGWLA